MQKQEKSRKPLVIGIVAAVVVLAALLALILVNCSAKPDTTATTTQPVTTTAAPKEEVPTYTLYWNVDRAEYDGKSEAGMSSRMPEADGYFHVRFIVDGQEVIVRVADRKVINAIDVKDLMGLEFDKDGIAIDVIAIEELPLEKVAWQFYVQSVGGKLIKANSSESFEGMEAQLQGNDKTGVYDMTGISGPVGSVATPIGYDRILAIQNLAGELTHVFIYERPDYLLTHEGYCQHCEENVTWREWTKDGKLPITTGHYQLMEDIQLTGQMSFSGQDQKICLDLNGHKVDGKRDNRIYSLHNVGASLAIMDTSEEQTGALIAHGKADQGMCVWLRYGQFHFYGGTLDASDARTKLYGTAVAVPKNTYMYMYGGTIIGGTAEYQKDEKTGKYSRGYGGTIQVSGKLVIHDGEIRDGKAPAVTYWSNGTQTTTRGYGGNIFMSTGSVVEINGGVIKNGTAGSSGGNIYMDGTCELTMNGGSIIGGKVTNKGKNGGSIYVTSKATFTMNGGSISGGVSYNAGGNVYANGIFNMNGGSISGGKVYDWTTKKLNANSTNTNVFLVNGVLNMYGGRIYGGVGVTDTSTTDAKRATVALGGYATIKADKAGQTNLTINTGGNPQVIVGKLQDSAAIGVNTARGIFTNPTKEENRDNFFSDIAEAEILYTEKGLALGRMRCVCGKDTHINGCDGTTYLWAPWISATSLPKTEGNYFLTKDVITTGQTVVSKGHTVRLDLNGHDASYKVAPTYSDGFRVYRSAFESLLVITDTTEKCGTLRSLMPTADEVQAAVTEKLEKGEIDQAKADQIIAGQKAGNSGQILWARGGDIVVHNGILDGSMLVGSKSGMVVNVGANTASEDGGVTRKGSFTMYGGVIKGATSSSYGAAINSSSNGIIKIHGGIIEGGKSTANAGGNVYAAGEFYMDGGIIRDGVAYSSGGNLLLEGSKANATITGNAQILNGQAGDPTLQKDIGRGGNIRLTTKGAKLTLGGNAVISGGVVYRSASNNGGFGGNISVNTDTTMVMTGGTVEGGLSEHRGGNIDVCGSLTVTGGVITGGKAKNGGNIYLLNGDGRELIMTNGTIEKGHATGSGGNIYALAPVTISGGLIAEGKAHPDSGVSTSSNSGGNIYICNTMTVSGDAIIRDGYAGTYGGNISVVSDSSLGLKGVVTLSDNVQILNGTADAQGINKLDGGYGGNIRMPSNTSLTVAGNVLISGGTAIAGKYDSTAKAGGGGQGGNLYMTNAEVKILGGIVENGTASGGGGNIGASAPSGNLLLQDVIIRGGNAGTSYGGNIRLRNGMGEMTVTGNTQILDGKASLGGNIYMDGSSIANAVIGGKTLISGGNVGEANNGPSIYTGTKVHLTITDDAVIDATNAVGKRGGAIYSSSEDVVLVIDGNAKLIGATGAATTHGKVGYLRGDVTIGGNALLIAEGTVSYGTIYFYTGSLVLGGNAVLDASAVKATNGSAIYSYQGTATVNVQDNAVIRGGETTNAGGTIYMDGAGTLNIKGGTIYGAKTNGAGGAVRTTGKITMTGGTVFGGEATYGGAMYVYNGGSFTMTEGAIIGGSASKSGGALAIEANGNPATFTMTGGYIENGVASASGGNLWLYGNKTDVKATASITGGMIGHGVASKTSGGNIYMKNADLILDGGLIVGGTNGMEYTGADNSKPNGGSVYVGTNSVFTLKSGSVSGGKTINTGGNLVVYGKFVMNGGEVFGGCKITSEGMIADSNATTGNVYVVNGEMVMTSGHINGGVALYGDTTLKLSGDPSMVSDYEGPNPNELYFIDTNEALTIEGTLTTEGRVAKIRVNKELGRIFSTETTAENAAFFGAYAEGEAVFLNGENKLELGRYGCICGATDDNHIGDCDGTKYNWTAWTKTDSMPVASGYWFLTEDITITGQYKNRPDANSDILVDLNGKTVNFATNNGWRLYTTYNNGHKNNIHITLTDRSEGKAGKIVGTKQVTAENGPIVWLSCKGSILNVYHITIDGTDLKTADDKMGAVISASGSDAQVNLFNAKILGGKAGNGDAISINGENAVLRLEGDVVITGTEGDAIYWTSTKPIDITKLNSLNDGVCIYGEGTFTKGYTGTEVKWFSTTEDRIIELRDGELHLAQYHCLCEMPDGKHVEGFCDGTKYVWEPWSKSYMPGVGNWYLTGDVDAATDYRILATEGAVVRVDLNGYNFTSGQNRMFTTYKSGAATSLTTTVILTNTNAEDRSVVTITGSGNQGRVMWLRGENKTFKANNIDFVAAEGATGSANGFFFSAQPQSGTNKTGSYVELYNVTLTGGKVTDNSAAGALCAGANGNVVLKNVTISNCSGTEGGAIRMVGTSTLTMENVTINGCKASYRGGAIYATGSCAVTMENVSITGCTSTIDKGIYLNDKATAQLTGLVVTDIYRTANTTLDVADLATGSNISISGVEGVISANTYAADDADLTYLTAADANQYLIVLDGKLNLKAKSCICGMPDGKHVAGFCDGTMVAWKPLSGDTAPSESGYYILTGDMVVMNGADLSKKDANIVIDLNGHDIILASESGQANRMFTTYLSTGSTSNVSIKFTNTSTTDASTFVVEGSGDEGRIMWLTGSNKSLAIYNVDIDLSTAASKDNARKNGIAIAASGEGNTISMIDVTVTGGTSVSSGNLLYVGYGSSATLKNCEINNTKVVAAADGKGGTGGFAYIRGELTMTNCTVTGAGCATNGGAIYLYGESDTKKAHVTLTNCVFDNCVAGEFGGAIDVEKYADLEMINSTVKNCQSAGRAGAIHVNTGCTAELTNCTITGNTTTGKSRGGAIYSYQGTVTLLDCTVQNNSCTGTDPLGGGIYLYQADLTVGGKTVITGNKAADKESNVYTNDRKVIISTEKGLTKDSKIGVYSGAATVCSTATYAQKGLFTADKAGTMLVHDGTNLKVVANTEHWHCICGGQETNDPNHKCKDIKFEPITALAGGTEMESGNYYMVESFTITKGASNYVMYLSNVEVNLCLNGKTLTGPSGDRSFYLRSDTSATLTMTSCESGAKLTNASKYEGGLIKLFGATNTLNLYGGVTIDASAHTNTTTGTYGAAIHSKGTLNMYNATVIGSAKAGNKTSGGTITVAKDSVMYMYGGVIKDGRTDNTSNSAGNMYLSGTLYMYGGTITGGNFNGTQSAAANNLRITSTGSLIMSGGTIQGHVIAVSGATMKLSGDISIYHSGNRGIYMYGGKTNLLIGDLSDNAKIELIVMKDDSNVYYDVFASALDGYTLTEQDVACITAITTAGAKRGNIVLNADNTISVLAE